MGNLCSLLNNPHPPTTKKRSSNAPPQSNHWSRTRKDKKLDNTIREHALAAAILYRQQNGQFDRSSSLLYPNGYGSSSFSKKNVNSLPKSSSSRARSLTDPLLHPHQLVNQRYQGFYMEGKVSQV